MGVLFLFFYLAYLFIAITIYFFTKRFTSKKSIHKIVLLILCLIPTYDIILTILLSLFHFIINPSTYIKDINKPIKSIYFKDTIYDGFNNEDRIITVKNYMNGIKLEKIALNGTDGKIYVYQCKNNKNSINKYINNKKELKEKIKKIKKEKRRLELRQDFLVQKEKILAPEEVKENKEKLFHLRDMTIELNIYEKIKKFQKYIKKTPEIEKVMNELKLIKTSLYKQKYLLSNLYNKHFEDFEIICLQNKQVFDKENMPDMQYTFETNEIELNLLSRFFLYSDERKLIENETKNIIAYNQRFMRFHFNVFPDIVIGGRYFDYDTVVGDDKYDFEHNLFKKTLKIHDEYYSLKRHRISINKYLDKKYNP